MWFYTFSPHASITESLPSLASLVMLSHSNSFQKTGSFSECSTRLRAYLLPLTSFALFAGARIADDTTTGRFFGELAVILPRRWATIAFSPRKLVMSLFYVNIYTDRRRLYWFFVLIFTKYNRLIADDRRRQKEWVVSYIVAKKYGPSCFKSDNRVDFLMSMWEDCMENYIFGWLCVYLNTYFTFEKYGLVLKQNTQSWQLLGALLCSPPIGTYGLLLCMCVCVIMGGRGCSVFQILPMSHFE